MTPSTRRGFTLIEAMLALSLSSIILASVFSMLLSQGRGLDRMDERAQQLEQTRGAADLLAAEVSDLTRGSVLAAAPDSVTFRLPLSWGVVCGSMSRQAKGVKEVNKILKLPDVDSTAIMLEPVPRSLGVPVPEGFAMSLNGIDWTYYAVSNWSALNIRTDNRSGKACTGENTSNDEYKVFPGLGAIIGREPNERALIMTYARVTYAFRNDPLVPGGRALFRGGSAGLQRLAGPYTSASTFSYRMLDRTESASVSSNYQGVVALRVSFSPMNRNKLTAESGSVLQPWLPFYNSRE